MGLRHEKIDEFVKYFRAFMKLDQIPKKVLLLVEQ
jgi:hypothetical protein